MAACASNHPPAHSDLAEGSWLGADAPRPPARPRKGAPHGEAEQKLRELSAENMALRADCARLQRLFDCAAEHAIVTLDLAGRITGLNAGARAILRYEDSEILGRSGEVLLPPEERAERAFLRDLCHALNGGRAQTERWHLRRDGTRFWASGSVMPLLGEDAQPEGFMIIFRDASDSHALEERRALLLAEMGHRVKNTLATVQGVATQTLRRADVPAEVHAAFSERLLALARSHELLLRGGWESAPLAEIAERALSPYGGADRVQVGGPPVLLPAIAVEGVGLAFHELATNAAKHGALSAEGGRVDVRWRLRRGRHGPPFVDITWRERGGPRVEPPKRRGFGSRLLGGGLAEAFGGSVKLEFLPEGVSCHICLPVAPQ